MPGVDHATRSVMLDGKDAESVAWAPNRLAARSGGVEVYRAEDIELRASDRIRWTRPKRPERAYMCSCSGLRSSAVGREIIVVSGSQYLRL